MSGAPPDAAYGSWIGWCKVRVERGKHGQGGMELRSRALQSGVGHWNMAWQI